MGAVVDRPSIADEALLSEYLAGDVESFTILVRRHRDRIHQFVGWFTGARGHTAEDLTQDVFLQVLRSAGSFGGRSSFRTWLFAVARHVCTRHIRRDVRRRNETAAVAADLLLQIPDIRPGPLERLERRNLTAAVRREVAALAPQHRVVLMLRDREELSYENIAEALGIPVGTVRSRLHNARASLAARLAPLVEEAMP